jgi:RHS repeat-associated protein
VLWPLADHLGTLRDLAAYDPQGTPGQETSLASHRTFDSFGNLVDETNPAVDILFAFTGRDRDEETGLQYHRARYYDPTLGRWLSEDPIGFAAGDPNISRYVINYVTGATDWSGLEPSAKDKKKLEESTGWEWWPGWWEFFRNLIPGCWEGAKTQAPPGMAETAGVLEATPDILRIREIAKARQEYFEAIIKYGENHPITKAKKQRLDEVIQKHGKHW